MRVKLTFLACKRAAILPLNYNHAVASLIYGTLKNASSEFADMLHNEGFGEEGRRFKLFTFSRLIPRRSKVIRDYLLLEDPAVSLQVSSPVAQFIEHFVMGLGQSQKIAIAGVPFTLEHAEILPAPIFVGHMSFRALSPVTEALRDENGGIRFLTPDDQWTAVMQRNLIRKYHALYGRTPANDDLHWKWDQAYLEEASKRGRRASVLIDIRGIKVRGWLIPFTVEGSPELIEIGYEAGFGSRNSMGFGMAEVVGGDVN